MLIGFDCVVKIYFYNLLQRNKRIIKIYCIISFNIKVQNVASFFRRREVFNLKSCPDVPRELIYQPHSQLSQWLLLTALFQSWCMMRHLHTDSVVSEVDRRICGSLHRTKQSKHVICLHLDTLITAFLTRPPYLYACVLLHKNTMYGRFREMDEKGAYLFFYMQVCIFVCVCVHVWLYAWPIAEPCGIVKKKNGCDLDSLWKRREFQEIGALGVLRRGSAKSVADGIDGMRLVAS